MDSMDSKTRLHIQYLVSCLIVVFGVPWLIVIVSAEQVTYWRGVLAAVAFLCVAEHLVKLVHLYFMKK